MPDQAEPQRGREDDSGAYLAATDGSDAWTAATADYGGSQKLLDVETIDPLPRLVDALQLSPDERLVVRRRLILRDGRPVEIANSYYPEMLARDTPLALKSKIKGGAIRALSELSLQADYADEEIELDSRPTFAEAGLLDVSETTRIVRLFRVAYTANDVPFEVTEAAMLPAGRVLRHRISVD